MEGKLALLIHLILFLLLLFILVAIEIDQPMGGLTNLTMTIWGLILAVLTYYCILVNDLVMRGQFSHNILLRCSRHTAHWGPRLLHLLISFQLVNTAMYWLLVQGDVQADFSSFGDFQYVVAILLNGGILAIAILSVWLGHSHLARENIVGSIVLYLIYVIVNYVYTITESAIYSEIPWNDGASWAYAGIGLVLTVLGAFVADWVTNSW